MEEDKRIGKDDPEYEREQEEARLKLLRRAWIARNNLYRELFGEPTYVTPASYGPPSDVMPEEGAKPAKYDKHQSLDTGDPGDSDPTEQHLAVLAYGPDPFRPYWTYVTAGISSPWVQSAPADSSGFGLEFVIKSPIDHPFAPQLLRTLAFYIFNHAGVISPGVRIGLNGPIVPGSESLIRNAIIWYVDEAPDAWYQLPSGGFGMFSVIGITEAEAKYAQSVEKYGTWCIEQLLRRKGIGQVSDPHRGDMMSEPDTADMLIAIKQFADTFRENEEAMELGAGAQVGEDFSF
jgi:hypothetical protein